LSSLSSVAICLQPLGREVVTGALGNE